MEEEEWFREHGKTLGIRPPREKHWKNSGNSGTTDYNRWAKYNVDAEESLFEVKFAREDFQRAEKAMEDLSKEKLVSTGADAQELAEVLRAQDAVAALRASRGSQSSAKSQRRREKGNVVAHAAAPFTNERVDAHGHPFLLPTTPAKTKSDDTSHSIDQSSIYPVVASENVTNTLSTIMNKTSVTFGELLMDLESLSQKVDTYGIAASHKTYDHQ